MGEPKQAGYEGIPCGCGALGLEGYVYLGSYGSAGQVRYGCTSTGFKASSGRYKNIRGLRHVSKGG